MKWVLALAPQLLLAAAIALVPRGAAAAQAQPHISLQPDVIPAGENTTASGTGFCPAQDCGPVMLTLEDTPLAGDITVAPDGTFSTRIFPVGPPGRYVVAATQDTPGGRLSADALLTLTLVDRPTPTAPPAPTTTASPPAGTPGPPDATVTATPSPPPFPSPSPSGSPLSHEPSARGSDGDGFPWWAWVAFAVAGVSAVFAAVFRPWRRHRIPKL